MSGWRRCDRCRKVRSTDEFEGEATTCAACVAGPPAPAARKRATPVKTTRTAPRPPVRAAQAAEPAARRPLLGSVGSGDLEVRERRARRGALEALAVSHPEEFALLLRDARAAEGLRATSNGTGSSPDGE